MTNGSKEFIYFQNNFLGKKYFETDFQLICVIHSLRPAKYAIIVTCKGTTGIQSSHFVMTYYHVLKDYVH